jgi:N-acetylmuramoyl-L-alanine amidase
VRQDPARGQETGRRSNMILRFISSRVLWSRGIGTVCAVVLLAGLAAGGPLDGPAAAASSAPGLTKIAHMVIPDRTRVVFDLTAQASYEIRPYANPDRIAVNLRDVIASSDVCAADIEGGIVRRVRVNRLPWGTQVVFDLRGPAGWSEHYLQPVDGMPGRVVIDISDSLPGEGKSDGNSNGNVQSDGKDSADVKSGGDHDADGGLASDKAAADPTGKSPSGDASRTDSKGRVYVVAVDAGHGGKHYGTTKGGLVEKDLTLDISRRVARKLNETKGFKAVLTRDSDVFLDLVDRPKIAKRKGADIFVSIHLNSAPRKEARGIEVWFISPAGAEATAKRILSNRDAAARELGLDEPESSDIMNMLVDVNQQAMMQKSVLLAEEILSATERSGLPPSRSVKQQSWAVLKSIDMPSVLVEGGFLTNSKDAAFVKESKGRQALAEAVAAGIVSYLKKYPPPEPTNGAGGATVVHRVKAGETLWAISQQYNTTVASIRSSNRLGESDVLVVGQELVIRDTHDHH